MRLRLFVAIGLASIIILKSAAHAGEHHSNKSDMSKIRPKSRRIASVPGSGMLMDTKIGAGTELKQDKPLSKPVVVEKNPFFLGKDRPF
jgi:hypothetical protein